MARQQYLPRTTVSAFEFLSRFPNEEVARKHIEQIRWKGQIICPYCGKHEISPRREAGYYRCRKCRQIFTVRVGTIFHRSHIPLHKWLYAIYLVMTSRKGVSSVQLAQELGIRQGSAWYLLQRIREALGRNDDDADGSAGSGMNFLKGIVEIDEAYLGGRNENRHESKRFTQEEVREAKTMIVGMRERGTGRTRGVVVGNVAGHTLAGIVYENVETDSVVCTDYFRGYSGITPDFTRMVVNHSAKIYVDGMAHTNGIESFWAVLKRGFYGVFHWFSSKHTQRYVNEFAFRMDKGSVRRHSYERMDSVLVKMFKGRITYNEIISATV